MYVYIWGNCIYSVLHYLGILGCVFCRKETVQEDFYWPLVGYCYYTEGRPLLLSLCIYLYVYIYLCV